MMEHTPGPWRIEERHGHSSDGLPRWVITADSVDRLAICSRRGVHSDEEAEANARLIRAAPELLAACVALIDAAGKSMDIVTHDDDGHPLSAIGLARKQARAAIAKAEGRDNA